MPSAIDGLVNVSNHTADRRTQDQRQCLGPKTIRRASNDRVDTGVSVLAKIKIEPKGLGTPFS